MVSWFEGVLLGPVFRICSKMREVEFTSNRICGCNNTTTSLKRSNNTSFGNTKQPLITTQKQRELCLTERQAASAAVKERQASSAAPKLSRSQQARSNKKT